MHTCLSVLMLQSHSVAAMFSRAGEPDCSVINIAVGMQSLMQSEMLLPASASKCCAGPAAGVAAESIS